MIDTEALRKKVIDLAIQGKLTEQLPEDGSAEDLYAQIQEEKEKLIKEGKLKKQKPLPEIEEDEIPFEIPKNWKWVRVESLGENINNAFADGPFGSDLKKEHYTLEHQVRIIQLSNVGEDGWKNENEKYTTYEHLKAIKRSEVDVGNIVIAKMMPAGRAIIVPNIHELFVLSSDCVKFVPHRTLITKYLLFAINSDMFRKQVYQNVSGVGRVRTSLTKIKGFLLPLPSLDEQNRIVELIESTFKQIDIIDELQKKYNNDVEVLKSKVIDAGIQGKLTEQFPEDGNAEDLYNQIQEEKEKLIKEGKIKKQKPLPEIEKNEIPFEIPKNWRWVRLGKITYIERGGSPRPIKNYLTDSENGINWIKIGDVEKGGKYICSTKERIISEGEKKSRHVYPGDFLLTNSMSFGRPYISKIEGCIHDGWLLVRDIKGINSDYLYFLLSSSYMYKQFCKKAAGAAVDNLNIDRVNSAMMPFPTVSEQKRIADLIDKTIEIIK